MVKVSVIVPVYNPGSDIEECIASLLAQSLPSDEYEIIFVDDGSTDETPGRLDDLASAYPQVRVEHIPNSGWPGRPRNVGMDLARGEYIYFVDNDDWLGRRTLERLHATALRNESDVVIGKVVGHGKIVPRALFRRNRAEVTLDWVPLLGLLTPHKLFRKALLDEHGIRFAEGRRRLEDHLFVVHAYFHARRISVLASYPCYHWVRRDSDTSASWRRFDPSTYFDNVREVLDLVEQHTEPGPSRDRILSHWYRGKMLGRMGGVQFIRRDPQYRRELYEEIRRLALERYGPEVDAFLPFNLIVRSRLLRNGSYDSLGALAAFESQLRADVTVRDTRWEKDSVSLEFEVALAGEGEPLTLVRRGRWLWAPPKALQGQLSEDDLDLTDDLRKARVQVVVRSVTDGTEYVLPARSELVLLSASVADGGQKRPVLIAAAEISPRTAAAGSRLPEGQWQVRALVEVAGFRALTGITAKGTGWHSGAWLARGRGGSLPTVVVTRDGRVLRRLPVRHYLLRRFPWLRPVARRAGALRYRPPLRSHRPRREDA